MEGENSKKGVNYIYHANDIENLWQRQIGRLNPTSYVHRIGGSLDRIRRLELYASLDGHDGCVNTVQFNPSGKLLVSGSDDRQIIFWDWAAKAKVFHFDSGHASNVFHAKIMPYTDDRIIVTCAADGQVRKSQILENGVVETKCLAKHQGRTHKLALEPGSPHVFYSCGEDGVVQHFDLRSDSATKLFTCHAFRKSNKSRRSMPVRLNAIAINPRNPVNFAVGGSDEYARVYDIRLCNRDMSEDKDCLVDCYTPEHLIDNDSVHITGLAYSNQNELLVSYNDELIYLFNKELSLGSNPTLLSPERRKELKSPQVYKGHRNAQTVKGVNFFGPNTEYVVSGSDCGRIFIWKKKGGELVRLMVGDESVVNCLEPHPETTILATSGIEKNVKVWAPTAEKISLLPDNIDEIMETNRRSREDRSRISLTPDVIMRVLRLQRRQSQLNAEERQPADGDEDDSEDEINVLQQFLEEGEVINPQDCIIS